MLPGIRFLFVATVMSVSVLVFALGAAALLRATHENFATLPQRRPPEQVFVKTDTSRPVIALLRVEAEPEKTTIAAPSAIAASETPAPVTDAAEAAAPAQDAPASMHVAALNIPDPAPPATLDASALRDEILNSTAAKPGETAAAPAIETSAPAAPVIEPDATASVVPAPEKQTKVAALSEGSDAIARAADARKKAEAGNLRARKLITARRARASKLAAQRRRIATIRARDAKQKQEQQQPFAPLFNAN